MVPVPDAGALRVRLRRSGGQGGLPLCHREAHDQRQGNPLHRASGAPRGRSRRVLPRLRGQSESCGAVEDDLWLDMARRHARCGRRRWGSLQRDDGQERPSHVPRARQKGVGRPLLRDGAQDASRYAPSTGRIAGQRPRQERQQGHDARLSDERH